MRPILASLGGYRGRNEAHSSLPGWVYMGEWAHSSLPEWVYTGLYASLGTLVGILPPYYRPPYVPP